MVASIYQNIAENIEYDKVTNELGICPDSNAVRFQGDIKSKPYAVKVYSALDMLLPQPPVEWLVEPILAPGLISIFFGEPGCKKTWSTLDLAVCMAMGQDWLGFKTKQARVLLIDEESGIDWYGPRVKQVIEGHGGNYNIPLGVTSLVGFDLRDKHNRLELERIIKGEGIQAIVIDAMSDVMPDANENDSDDVRALLRPMRDLIAETHSALCMIHHNNKDGRYRGSSAVKQHADIFIKVISSPDSSVIRFKSEKVRTGIPLNFEANAIFGADHFHLVTAEK